MSVNAVSIVSMRFVVMTEPGVSIVMLMTVSAVRKTLRLYCPLCGCPLTGVKSSCRISWIIDGRFVINCHGTSCPVPDEYLWLRP